jgi:hypothetical protein
VILVRLVDGDEHRRARDLVVGDDRDERAVDRPAEEYEPIAVVDHSDDHVVAEDRPHLDHADGTSSHLGWGIPTEP